VLLIPAIDLRAGSCVRLYQGAFEAETRYAVEPEELVERYRALGATWLHLVDLDGASVNRIANSRESPAGTVLRIAGSLEVAETMSGEGGTRTLDPAL
jgi:phosphoribosylformimino-5-aminoimidazole carboxamide ribonucleotide (ProFAR) isomerase